MSRTHGMTNTKTFQVWRHMRQRCRLPTIKGFKNYGGRGIAVCDRWQNFENFLVDMGERPPGMQLDRIDNELGYFPENCRWATPLQNANNRRSSRFIEVNGQRQTLSQWAAQLGVTRDVVRNRLLMGWTEEAAVTKPLNRRRNSRVMTACVIDQGGERAGS